MSIDSNGNGNSDNSLNKPKILGDYSYETKIDKLIEKMDELIIAIKKSTEEQK